MFSLFLQGVPLPFHTNDLRKDTNEGKEYFKKLKYVLLKISVDFLFKPDDHVAIVTLIFDSQ